jgi:Co/Zn/Cd efflux system component
VIALLIVWESFLRFQAPIAINFKEAIFVAVVGLVVNIVCAWLLNDDHHHGHDHGDHGRGKDQNLRAAYVHVLADALTSVLAIAALTLGKHLRLAVAGPGHGYRRCARHRTLVMS